MSFPPFPLPALPASNDPLPKPSVSMDMTAITKVYKAGNLGAAVGYTFTIESTDECYTSITDIDYTELINIALMTLNPSSYVDTFNTERVYKLCSTTFPIGQLRLDAITGFAIQPAGAQFPLILIQPNISILCPEGDCIFQYAGTLADDFDDMFVTSRKTDELGGLVSGSPFVDNFYMEGITLLGVEDADAGMDEFAIFLTPARNIVIKDCYFGNAVADVALSFLYFVEQDFFAPGLYQSASIENCVFENNEMRSALIHALGIPDIVDPEAQAGRQIQNFVVSQSRFVNNTYNTEVGGTYQLIDLGLVDEEYPYEFIFTTVLNNCFENNFAGDGVTTLLEVNPGHSVVQGNSPINQDVCLLDLLSAEEACVAGESIDDKQALLTGNFSDELFSYDSGCGLEETFNPYPGKWFRYVGQGRKLTLNVCNGDNSESNRIQVFESCDGVDETKCYAAGGCAATVAGTLGVEYYILLTSDEKDETKKYELKLSCGRPCTTQKDCCAGNVCRRKQAGDSLGKCGACVKRNKRCTNNKECCNKRCFRGFCNV